MRTSGLLLGALGVVALLLTLHRPRRALFPQVDFLHHSLQVASSLKKLRP
jgi:hypothetical protein